MSHNPNINAAARVVAEAIVHGASSDVALDVAQALDDAGLLLRPAADPFTLPGRNRPAPSPAAVAALDTCRRAKTAADKARAEVVEMPGEPEVSAAHGEVQIVVHPKSLADWKRWTLALGADDSQSKNTGGAMVARCTYRGVRTRLVGYGVPALLGSHLRGKTEAAVR
ncbi:hypothetical protein ACIQPP_05330 [Streptomyces violaceusniger]|uniref:hypothetical protein n=1 Tax=Streptomyces violaceusniger TaxID=68280 RepID=UPI0009C3A43F|nr:hypothetical protein [Streptomyces hygroscopicus]AQW55243.1 hypothetical protein SHXM_08706 [Streptomyces hygroscopicus]